MKLFGHPFIGQHDIREKSIDNLWSKSYIVLKHIYRAGIDSYF